MLAPFVIEQCHIVLAAEGPLVQAGSDSDDLVDPVDLVDLVDVVHDVRVAIRRLRSTVRTYRSAFDASDRQFLVAEGAWYAAELGALRDLDVIEERIAARLDDLDPALVVGAVRTGIEDDLHAQRAARRGAIATVLRTERYAALRAMLQRWAGEPHWGPAVAELDLAHRARKAKKRLKRRRRVALAAIVDGSPDAAHFMHQTRKAAKRHRYAVEALAPVLGAKADEIIAKRKQQQDDLGSVQDSVVTADYLIGLARRIGNRSGRNAFTLGVLVAAERASQAEAQRRFAAG